ncbi:hypothetical protein KGF57_000033 [Candida theae]|uniref:Uncharacterized protein n=1 Tax=Candida theae TaxID=1198502 RepID=A0AAD5BJQ0_9ASCO|nr:uncharacterized protein KGF57_000033 [Candida theae]KAI5968918.1 hypothetical protein KGF57_000033 [Candida theae]
MTSDKPANEPTTNETQNYSKGDQLGQKDLDKIQEVAKGILNPNNENPQINEYIQSTLSYIGNAMYKMQTTNDKNATAKEIADDLTAKFESWKEQRDKQEKQDTGDANSNTDKNDEEKK